MDSPGDPHPHTPAPTEPLQEQTRGAMKRARKKAMKRARWRQKRELRQEAISLELEQGPSELQKEDPQVCQISPSGTLATGSHGHPGTPAPTNPHEKQDRRAMKKANKPKKLGVPLQIDQGPCKHQKGDLGKSQITPGSLSPPAALATGNPEIPASHTQHIEEQARRNRHQREPPEFQPEYPLYRRRAGRLYSSSTLVTSSPAPKGARVRQSVLYSGRPMRSKKTTTDKILVEEHVGEVSSREFEALTLDQSPTRVSTHRPAGAVTRVRQSALYSGRPRQSRGRQDQEPSQNKLLVEEKVGMASGSEGPTADPPELKALALNEAPPKPELSLRSKECDTASSETESEVVVEEESEDESDFDLEEERRKLEEYKERMFNEDFAAQSTTLAASCDKSSAVEHVTEYSGGWGLHPHFEKKKVTEYSGDAEWARRAYITQTESLLAFLDARRTMAASSRDKPRCEVSDEDITENGNKWMSEEVMVAFNEYIGRNDELKKLDHCFEKLCHQCFNVEFYFKIFHHFNFDVKTKLPGSDDWISRTYFAEVKEMFGEKFYFCCPLELRENGQCYACHNQGVDDLRHPATGGYERGFPDTVFPYM